MFFARIVACLTCCALLGAVLLAPGMAAAQAPAPPELIVVVSGERLMAELPCAAGATPAAAIDGVPIALAAREPVPAQPVALALVIDTGPAMAEAGTPHSTRLADAAMLATALLDRAAPGSLVTVVGHDLGARVLLPLTAAPEAPRRTLAALAPLSLPQHQQGPALLEALRLAAEELQGASASSRAVVAFTAGGHEQLHDLDNLRQAFGAELPVLVVDHAVPAGDVPRGELLPFAAPGIEALPGLVAAFDARANELLGRDRVRLTLPIAALPPGAHELTVQGCGAALSAGFERQPGLLAAVGPGVVAAGCGGLALLLWRRRAGEHRPRRTQRLQTTADATTGRRTEPLGRHGVLRVVVLDGRERRVARIAGRHCTVGRDAGCDIVLTNHRVSGLHARLSRSGDEVEIADLGSTNGTFLGAGERCLAPNLPVPLAPGEVVLIGQEVRLALLAPGEDADDIELPEVL